MPLSCPSCSSTEIINGRSASLTIGVFRDVDEADRWLAAEPRP